MTAARLLLDIINDILDLSKIEAGRMELFPEAVEARDVFEACLRMVSGRAQSKRRDAAVGAAAGPAADPVDPRALQQMITNLLTNAGEVHAQGRPRDADGASGRRSGGAGASPIPASASRPGISPRCWSPSARPTTRSRAASKAPVSALPIVKALVEQSRRQLPPGSKVDGRHHRHLAPARR